MFFSYRHNVPCRHGALRGARWPARMQMIDTGPLAEAAGSHTELWLDGGHNPSAGAAIANSLLQLGVSS